MMEISQEERNRIELAFIRRMITQKVKYKSKDFYKRQIEFFSGVMTALYNTPPYWVIPLMSDKEIVAEYKIN